MRSAPLRTPRGQVGLAASSPACRTLSWIQVAAWESAARTPGVVLVLWLRVGACSGLGVWAALAQGVDGAGRSPEVVCGLQSLLEVPERQDDGG